MFLTEWALWILQLVPSWKQWLELGPRAAKPTVYKYEDGMGFDAELHGGVQFPQSFCVSISGQPDTRVQFTDDVIFANGKVKLFQIVALLSDIDQVSLAKEQISGLDKVCSQLSPAETTFFVRNHAMGKKVSEERSENLFRIASAEEFSSSELCNGRQKPRLYDEDNMWALANGKRYVILRYDKFIFAACNNRAELEAATKKLRDLFPA